MPGNGCGKRKGNKRPEEEDGRQESQLADVGNKTASKAWGTGGQKDQVHPWNREVSVLARRTAGYFFGTHLP